jgi:hypothetical protein
MKNFNNVVDDAYKYIKHHHSDNHVSSEEALNIAMQHSGCALSPKDREEALGIVDQARQQYYPDTKGNPT